MAPLRSHGLWVTVLSALALGCGTPEATSPPALPDSPALSLHDAQALPRVVPYTPRAALSEALLPADCAGMDAVLAPDARRRVEHPDSLASLLAGRWRFCQSRGPGVDLFPGYLLAGIEFHTDHTWTLLLPAGGYHTWAAVPFDASGTWTASNTVDPTGSYSLVRLYAFNGQAYTLAATFSQDGTRLSAERMDAGSNEAWFVLGAGD